MVAAEPVRYDFNTGAQNAEQVHGWIARHMPDRPHPPVKRPVNYVLWIVSTVVLLGGSAAVYKIGPYVLPIIQNRNVWATVTMIVILACTGGQMFNNIRKVPYVSGDGKGGISYFTGGFQNQLGIETQIIGFICECPLGTERLINPYANCITDGALSFMVIALILRAPRLSDSKIQQALIIGLSGGIFVIYGLLLSIFRVKNGGYPFSLPPFV